MRERTIKALQRTAYEVLQVSPNADPAVIHASYRALARRYHPDLNSDPQAVAQMRELNAAYDVLSDTDRRAKYDAQQWRARRPAVARRRPVSQTSVSPAASARVMDSQLGAGSARIRFALIVVILVTSLALALWLLIEALMDSPWSVFLA